MKGIWSASVSAVALLVAGVIGIALKQPWLFPSLGPTLMVVAETPDQPAARPRSVLVGHLVGIAAGWLALLVTGLRTHPSAVQEGLSTRRVAAACFAVALTALVLQALDCPHPPAGATTLIVALGVLKTAPELRTMMLSVIVVAAVAFGFEAVRRRSSAPSPTR